MNADVLALVGGRRGHFQMESGHHGDFWLDLETLCLRPLHIQPLATQLASRLAPYNIDVVCGPLVEGAFVGLLVADELDCEFTYANRLLRGTSETLYPVEYKLPTPLHRVVKGKRMAIINDVIGAGSAVRGAFADLQSLGAEVVVIGTLLVLGTAILQFATDQSIALETLSAGPSNLWVPTECPLCAAGTPLESVGDLA